MGHGGGRGCVRLWLGAAHTLVCAVMLDFGPALRDVLECIRKGEKITMEPISVDLEQLYQAVRAEAEEKPDFRYRPEGLGIPCQYTHHSNGVEVPGCIVGAGLFRIGKPLRAGHWANVYPAGVEELFCTNGTPRELQIIDWLGTVQGQQDDGEPWARAVEFADRQCGIED